MNPKSVSTIGLAALLVGFSTIQVAPSYAVLQEIGQGLDELGGIIQEFSNSQESSIEINGDNNDVNFNQDQEARFETENKQYQEVSTEIHASETGRVFKVIVEVGFDEDQCGEEIEVSVAWKERTEILCEGDERSMSEQKNDPIISEGYEFQFPRGEISDGETFKACVDNECKIKENTDRNKPERVFFNL